MKHLLQSPKRLFLWSFKRFLTQIGAHIRPQHLHQLQMVVNYMKLGRWMADNQFRINPRVCDRDAVFEAVAKRISDKQVLYLEFGVFKGASMRYWANSLKHPKTQLHGFDSFEGLPEDFDNDGGPYVKGTFDLEGVVPHIDDSRVRFFRGWFDKVLPNYTVTEHEVLVLTMDADLYSSTIYVLRHLRQYKPGTFIYFDDMSRPDHEPRAFVEFMRESAAKFRVVSADYSLNCVFFGLCSRICG